jgi:Lanthionine synthetase C-like protein
VDGSGPGAVPSTMDDSEPRRVSSVDESGPGPSEAADGRSRAVPSTVDDAQPRRVSAADNVQPRMVSTVDVDGLAAAAAKLAGMRAVDRSDQEWYVTAALACRDTAPVHPHRPAPAEAAVPAGGGDWVDPRRLVSAACGLADELTARALRGGGRANWVGLEPVEDRYWSVLPMGAGLAHGYPGVALFLAQLAAVTGVDRYRDLAAQAVGRLPLLVEALAADPESAAEVGTGAQDGLGGLAWAVARLGMLLPGVLPDPLLPTLVDLIGATPDRTPCVAAGTAGGLAALVAVHAATGLPAARDAAHAQAERLLGYLAAPPPGPPPPGFGHGVAGTGWALLRYADAAGAAERGPAAAEAGMSALRFELGRIDGAAAGVCSGAAGLLLAATAVPAEDQPARLTTARPRRPRTPPAGSAATAAVPTAALPTAALPTAAVPTAALPTDALPTDALRARCADRLAAAPPPADMTPCHGETGLLEALLAAGSARTLTGRVGALLDRLDHTGPYCGTPGGVLTPGLLTGLAGIGYGLLRVGLPEQVPSALTLGLS